MLERVKAEVIRLIDEFLLGDLGFERDGLKVVFSGGRGYHVHINDPRVMKLTSHERREIVDYVTGTDLDIDWIFPSTPFEARRFKDRIGAEYRRTMPKLDDGGWRTRMRKGIDELLLELESLDEDTAMARISEALAGLRKDTGERTIEGLYSDLFRGQAGRRGVDRMRSEDTFEVFSQKRHGDAFVRLVEMRVKGRMKGETDEPVTSDIKRLIRLPSSLHGKTGFEVVPMKRDDLDDFDPFTSAVPKAFTDEEVGVRCEEPVEVRLRDTPYSLDRGVSKVPEFVAAHLVCRRLASIEP
jgi:DNA primase small subunit